MTSATNIITYIGVPLAVLGVLPILYTSFRGVLSLFVQWITWELVRGMD